MDRVTFSATAALTGNTLSGIAHAFGQRAMVGGKWVEFAVGAFDKALQASDIRAFVNHNTDLLLGRQSNGTVRVDAQRDGLHYEIDLPGTTYADDLRVLIDRGDLNEMSFGVMPGAVTYSKAPDGKQVVTHTSVRELFDISPVSIPAFTGTNVMLHGRSLVSDARSQATQARNRAYHKEI